MSDYAVDEAFEALEREFNQKYDVLEPDAPLGEGTYGKVFKARENPTGRIVALKKMKLDADEEGLPSTAVREIALLKELSHPNVVKLLDVFCSTQKLIAVFELVDSDLRKYMKSVDCCLTSIDIKNLSYQLCLGVEFCHANRIIHRDLKPQNLLIDTKMRLKIADFGLARPYTVPVPKYTHEVVTVWYRALEILLGSPIYSIPVDLWSVGCIIGEMALGRALFAGDSEIHTIFQIFEILGTPSVEQCPSIVELPDFKPTFPKWAGCGLASMGKVAAKLGPEGISLVNKLLVYDPKKRISACCAVDHSYFLDAADR